MVAVALSNTVLKLLKAHSGFKLIIPSGLDSFKLKLFIPVVLSSLKHPKVVVQVYSKTKYVKIWFQ